jgi:hypothetical protein
MVADTMGVVTSKSTAINSSLVRSEQVQTGKEVGSQKIRISFYQHQPREQSRTSNFYTARRHGAIGSLLTMLPPALVENLAGFDLLSWTDTIGFRCDASCFVPNDGDATYESFGVQNP